jgi:hypothetical protein
VEIDPLRDRPARRVDRREALLEALQLPETPGVGGRRVVGYAADPRRLLEGAPLAEQRE